MTPEEDLRLREMENRLKMLEDEQDKWILWTFKKLNKIMSEQLATLAAMSLVLLVCIVAFACLRK